MKIRHRQRVTSREPRARRCRGLALGVVLAVVLALPVGAAGNPAPESVIGSGQVAATQFSIAVSGGPFGQNPTGSLDLQGFFTFTATPTCMNIAANGGVAGFRIDNGALAGEGFLAASEPDASGHTVQYSAVLTAPPTACPPDDAPVPPNAIENGGGGSVFSGQITDAGGPPNPLPLSQHQFPTATGSLGRSIAQARDGTLWFTEPSANQLVSISDDSLGTMHEYDVPTADAGISSIAPDLSPCMPTRCAGDMWFTESTADRVGQVSPNGSISEYLLPTAGAQPSSIAGDPTGGAWFTEPGADRVGHVSGSGAVIEYQLPTRGADPIAITADGETANPAGGAWFVEKTVKRIGFIDTSGSVSEYALPVGAGTPSAIVADVSDGGAAGAWFLEPSANAVGHIDAAGDINQYPIPTPNASPQGLAEGTGPDGSAGAWFSETGTGQLGFISSSGQFSEFTLPGANPGAIAFAASIDVPPTDGYSQYEAVWWTDAAARNVSFATFPLNVSSGVPLVPAPPLPSYVRLSLARRVTVRGGGFRLTLRCAGDSGQCRGRVSVALAAVRAARVAAPFAKASFGILAGHRRTLVLKLDRRGLQLLRTHGRGLPVSVDISSRGRFIASRRAATLRLG